MRASRWCAAAAATAVALTPAPAYAKAAPCNQQPAAGPVSRQMPYEDQLYDLPRLSQLANGAGIRIAVVDSGVDNRHPQLKGQVAGGLDLLHSDPDARQDCVGHGTAVASIIAARQVDGVPFHGLAPGATIVPVRLTEKEVIDGKEVGDDGSPAEFAEAIDYAADPDRGNADIINLSIVMTRDNSDVRTAVREAIGKGVVIVAAAGNNGGPNQANAIPYPAAYPGVIGVGAVGPTGTRAQFSQHGPYVDLVAAGDGVTVATPGSGHTSRQGTSFAAPYVTATAALILQRLPTLTPAQVQRRLTATADPAPGGGRSDEYGYGLLNPYRALTETLSPDNAPAPAPAAVHSGDPAAAARQARRDQAADRSLIVGAAGLGLALLGAAAATAIRRGRRRGWRPPDPTDDEEPATQASDRHPATR